MFFTYVLPSRSPGPGPPATISISPDSKAASFRQLSYQHFTIVDLIMGFASGWARVYFLILNLGSRDRKFYLFHFMVAFNLVSHRHGCIYVHDDTLVTTRYYLSSDGTNMSSNSPV